MITVNFVGREREFSSVEDALSFCLGLECSFDVWDGLELVGSTIDGTLSCNVPCGTRVAWDLIDGSEMAGQIVDTGFWPNVYVKRIDGTECRINASKLRLCNFFSMQNALETFAKIGA